MAETNEDSNKIPSILLSRNTPVAIVIGAAGFLGSHTVDKLLEKEIQLIGVDDLAFGNKDNLAKASENKNFHLMIESSEKLNLDLERLDYIFIFPNPSLNLKKILEIFKDLKSRLLLISSIELYDDKVLSESIRYLKTLESNIAKIAKTHNLNARILRLGPIFGPRMDFGQESEQLDPLVRLIQQTLTSDLQKDISLEFSSRALYIDDAVDLIIKCIFAGATAQKIFDGVSPSPIKISEVKQILLDPVWYENRDFSPSELPPWPTPNLEKTIKFLHWRPKNKIVSALKETLSYFKERDVKIPKLEARMPEKEVRIGESEWKREKAGELEGLKKISQNKAKQGTKKKLPSWVPLLFAAVIVSYGLLWPIVQLGWGVLTFRFQLSEAIKDLKAGEFDKGLSSVRQARDGVLQAKSILYSLEPLRKTNFLQTEFETGDNLGDLATYSVDSADNTILGIQALYKSLKSITGELNESPQGYFDEARTDLASADEDLSKAYALINNADFKKNLPNILSSRVNNLADRLGLYSNLVKKARALATLMPEVVALEGNKDYLVILQNNHELRPTGGFIGSLALVSFEGGKLKKLQVDDVYNIDGQLNLHVEPPKEIKVDLGQNDYFLRDSNWEPDFPTSARQISWFYTKETGERVEGIIALDISAIEDLLSVVGSLDLPDYNEKITSSNLFEKSISHAEVGFFPGSQAKKSFLTALTSALFNKLFFLPNQNWPGIVFSTGKSLEGKHMSIYLDDPKLFSYVVSQNWGSLLPRENKENTSDFLAPVEANLGANKANYYLDRSYNLETTIGREGEIYHKLRIVYTNRSPSTAFPAGKYKNRMRIYLPFGTKLNKASWGETEITKEVESFVDYGRSGYSFLIELQPKEAKTLVLDYQTPLRLDFKDNKSSYRLDILKQAGTLKDRFEWRVTYPINLRLDSNKSQKQGPQEQIIQTDLSTDRTFQLEFSR